ncbi:hypothetical protein CCP2SC5_1960001 [Azospirillaceae bacterium]
MARRERWGLSLPVGVAVLTAGVDVQGDRIELQVVGWGAIGGVQRSGRSERKAGHSGG